MDAIRSAWRRLTGARAGRDADRRTLVACSGGADSSALTLALARVKPAPIVAHVVHDLRPKPDARADRDATLALATGLGLEFVEASVDAAGAPGNTEAAARDRRYAALESLAVDAGCPFIATGHHADDQLETVLMRLLRGSSPSGLAGVRECRPVGRCTLVRPMLVVDRSLAETICSNAGWSWSDDKTNGDESRFRAAIRARVTPVLRELSPDSPRRAARAAGLLAQVGEIIDERVDQLLEHAATAADPPTFDRARLAAEPEIVLGAALRRLAGDSDQCGERVLDPIIAAIRDESGEQRRMPLGALQVQIGPEFVEISPPAGSPRR